MDFKNIPAAAHPAYTWLWNTHITREGIRRQIDEMYDAGIRAFYILGEPENFRPQRRRTHLAPEYLSDEYIDLVWFAYRYAKGKGMHTWLYNEGGFPSGSACGKIREIAPHLYMKAIGTREIKADSAYAPSSDVIAAFADGARVRPGDTLPSGTAVTEYISAEHPGSAGIRTDNAAPENTELFLALTHERLAARFGNAMGTDVTLMFDDESYMGTWTDDLDRIFYEKYGYDMLDYLPVIAKTRAPETESEYRAVSDYIMLCGELYRGNYLIPMRDWLRAHGMQSTGHLDRDNTWDGCVNLRYGNVMASLRAFDVPGIDVIWSQISYPDENGRCCSEGNGFFPRTASAAARQLGHSTAVSESFAVFGSHVTPEEMRFSVNYQAVRGISLFNFMVISYDRRTAMSLQYRPNFIGENPGMDCLGEIGTYTARLSHILQSAKAEVRTALYAPYRTICACGEAGAVAAAAYEAIGEMLEREGVSFDIIDEDFAGAARVENGVLIGEHVRYENVFVPEHTELEQPEILAKLRLCGREISPDIVRKNPTLAARKLCFADGSAAYFLVNQSGETVTESVTLPDTRPVYRIDLASGDVYAHPARITEAGTEATLTLSRGEGKMFLFTDAAIGAKPVPQWECIAEITDFTGHVTREYTLDSFRGPQNRYFLPGEGREMGAEWPADFSGEVTYTAVLPPLPAGEYMLELTDVRHFAKIFLNGRKIGESTMPPYRIPLCGAQSGDTLTVTVANTTAQACAHTEYFANQDPRDVGPYHQRMILSEAAAPAGGFAGARILRAVP